MKCIYLRTNLVNGKQYVGQATDFKQREREWNCLKKEYAGSLINNARAKYGLDKWKVEILKECSTQDELNKWEMYFIKFLKTKKPFGYNLTDGGETSSGYKLTDEHIDKIREYGMFRSSCRKPVLQYDMDGNFVREWMSGGECKRNGFNQGAVDDCCRGRRRRYKNYQWRFKYCGIIPLRIEPYDTELTRILMSNAQKGKKQTLESKMKKSKPILQYDLKGNFIREWYGANAAAKELGLSQANIFHALKKEGACGGFMFRYKKGAIDKCIAPYKKNVRGKNKVK